MSTKHTPGPWQVIDRGDTWNLARFWVGAAGAAWRGPSEICAISTAPYSQANARLIAAAPELLDVLRRLVESPNAKQNALWDDARAALAKAEGLS